MEIVNASPDYVEYISNGLVSHFSRANQFFGYPRYKDDYEIMNKHVKRRIIEGDEHHYYFVAIDDESPVGFLNFYINEHNIGTIIAVYGDSFEIKEELVKRAIKFAQENSMTSLECELFSYDDELLSFLKKYSLENQLIHFKINI